MGMGMMEVMDPSGHTKHIWDGDNADEVAAAKAIYDSLTKKGYRAFHVDKKGEEGTLMTTFDPDAEKMILAPALKGG